MSNCLLGTFYKSIALTGLFLLTYLGQANFTEAAVLSLSPGTGVYAVGSTFTVSVVVDSEGKPINAADGTLTFNSSELAVVSVNRNNSIFNLWVAEPVYSNTAGTVTFSGGSPTGYTGGRGTVMSITFKAVAGSTGRISFSKGSVLANDGKGTNVLNSMKSGSFTFQARSETPEPEEIEYVAPANTPAAPVITSSSHADPKEWYKESTATLAWKLPSDVIAVRTLLDDRPTSVPTKVYDTPISTIDLPDLDQGVSYFHIQFKNADGWGKVTHYRLAVDSENPTKIDISHPEGASLVSPDQLLLVNVEDATSKASRFKVRVDATDPFDYEDETGSSTIPVTGLTPGYHTVIIEAFDEAGNSIVGTYSFTIESFAKPTFTEYPNEINDQVIPVIKGQTRPRSQVSVMVQKVGSEPVTYTVTSSDSGEFILIPEGKFSLGVYELWAVATDEFGAVSENSDRVRIAVQQPVYHKVGTELINILSIIVPLIALALLLVLGSIRLYRSILRLRKKVRVESIEALDILHREFSNLQLEVARAKNALEASRKVKKLTKAESDMLQAFQNSLAESEQRVRKEIEDVSELVELPSDPTRSLNE